jgi:hypothetical protein
VQLEHEVDQRARQPRARAHQDGEARARHARRALEIKNAERGAELPVRLRLEIQRPRLAVAPDFAIVLRRTADRDGRIRHVRHRHQQIAALLFDAIELGFERLDPVPPGLVRGKNRGRIQSLLLGPRDFLARGVLLALEPLDLGNQSAAPRIERGKRPEHGLGIHAAVAQRGTYVFHVVANIRGVEHDAR